MEQMNAKTMPEYFRDWESYGFGFGYGSGEMHTIGAVRGFLALCFNGDCGRCYDFQELENALTPAVAWLLINTLAGYRVNIIEYGTSPRYAWLTPEGEKLRDFMLGHSVDELVEMTQYDCGEYYTCTPDYCNCDDGECINPFWKNRKGRKK